MNLMSVKSDDTDLLVLIPHDVFLVPDEPTEQQISKIENDFFHLEYDSYIDMNNIRRYGSVEALTPPPSRSLLRSRSLHGTPNKQYLPSHRNILTSDSYVTQKQKDDERLREVDEYFSRKDFSVDGAAESSPYVSKLDISQLQKMLSEVDVIDSQLIAKSNAAETAESNHVESVRKTLLFDSPSKSSNENKPCSADQLRTQLTIRTDDDNSMLSLHGLWSGHNHISKTSLHEEMKVLKQRIEEERLRRQHCEELIRELQKRLLESQEKLAVAIKVDNEKNFAIKRLKESWSRAVEEWKEADGKRIELSNKLKELEASFSEERNELVANVKKYEQELLNTLDLVHDYKEQQLLASRERDLATTALEEIHSQLETKDIEFAKLKEEVEEEREQLKEKTEIIRDLSISCMNLKKDLQLLQRKNEQLLVERDDKILLQNKLDDSLKREVQLEQQLRTADKAKADIKQHYQDQVELIVSEKRKDFQQQLVNAEKKLVKQFEAKEKEFFDNASRERQQLIDSHKREVEVLEETHRQTEEYYKMDLGLCVNKIDDLQSIIGKEQEQRRLLVEKLYIVVQNQWKETLNLVAPQAEHNLHELQSAMSLEICGQEAPKLKRQHTFTMAGEKTAAGRVGSAVPGGDGIGEPSGSSAMAMASAVHRGGSCTYRINETPQKIPNQRAVKDYMQQVMVSLPSSKEVEKCKLDKEKR